LCIRILSFIGKDKKRKMSGGNASLPILVAVIFVMLMLYVILGTYMEHKHAPFGHETGVALIAGLIISAAVHYSDS
jgi:hypothetical protein